MIKNYNLVRGANAPRICLPTAMKLKKKKENYAAPYVTVRAPEM